MGITIYYRGFIEDISLIEPIQQEMMEFCQSMNWRYHLWNEDLSKPFNARIVHTSSGAEIKGHIPLRGISIDNDPNNEKLNILFNSAGRMSSFMHEILIHEGSLTWDQAWLFVKTQFGTVDAHIAIIKLLQYLKQSYIPTLEVKDEGEYWETADKERLIARRGYLFGKMTKVEKALSSIKFDHEPSRDEVIQKIDRVLRRLMNDKR